MKRQLNQEIINYLYHQSDFVTSEQIALELDVSKATVTRRIAEINLMKDGTGQKIVSERGRGYKLSSEVYFRFDGKQEESVADERCNEIIYT
ncbi:helix-turn-helix domain-containing protein [Streptococcus suis]|nr:helix-turn-helix domain-containing protein [Streptococcus suis]